MIEALFKNYNIFIFFLFNIFFCINEKDLASNSYVSSYHPICSDTCFDFYLKENSPYLGLYWMVSHNLLISSKISLYNDKDNDIYMHNLSGFDLNIFSKNNHELLLSFDLNRSLYYENQDYGWNQISLIYLAKIKKSNFQIILDSVYDKDWTYKVINYTYGINIFHSVFLNIGLMQNLSNNNLDGFLTINFNI